MFRFQQKLKALWLYYLVFGINLTLLGVLVIFYLNNRALLKTIIDPAFVWLFAGAGLIVYLLENHILRSIYSNLADRINDIKEQNLDIKKLEEASEKFHVLKEIHDGLSEIAFALNKERLEKQVFYDMASAFTDFSSFDELLETLITKLASHFRANYAHIILATDEGLKLAAAYGFDKTKFEDLSVSNKGVVGWVINHGQPVLCRNVHTDPRYISLMEDTRSELAVPIKVGKKLVGAVNLESSLSGAFTQKDLKLLQAASPEIGLAIEVAQLYETLQHMAFTDSLTGLYNYRYFQERLEEEFQRAKRYERHLSLLFIDVDDFKGFNDRYGHVAGDMLLSELGELIKTLIRASDIAVRYGGEEFCVILPETDKQGAVELAERIRERVENHTFGETKVQKEGHEQDNSPFISNVYQWVKNLKAVTHKIFPQKSNVTISVGVASYPEDASDKENIIEKADKALYLAKKGGKNKVIENNYNKP